MDIEAKQRTHTRQSPPSQSSAGQKARVLELKGIWGWCVWGGDLERMGSWSPWRWQRRGELGWVAVPGNRRVQVTQPWQGWYPGREPFLLPLASPGASSGAGVREREEGRLGEFPRLSCSFHKSPQSRWRRSREVRGAGAQRGGTRHLPFPRRFLSFSSFSFSSNLPLSPLARWLPWPSSPIAAPPPLGAAGRPRRCRLPAPGLREAKARRLPACAPTVSPAAARPAPPGSGAAVLPDATASRGRAGVPGTARGPLPLPPAAGAADGGRPRSRAVAGRPLSLEAAAARAEASGPGEESFAGCAERALGAPPVALSPLPGARSPLAGSGGRQHGPRAGGRGAGGGGRPGPRLPGLARPGRGGSAAAVPLAVLRGRVLAAGRGGPRRLLHPGRGASAGESDAEASGRGAGGRHHAGKAPPPIAPPNLPGILPLLRRAPSPVQVPLDHAPTSPARTAPLPLPPDTSVLCTGSPHAHMHTHSSLHSGTPPPFFLCRSPCPLHGTHFPSHPALLSPQGFSDSLAPPSLMCTVLLLGLVFTPSPLQTSLPSLCTLPGADGPAWLG